MRRRFTALDGLRGLAALVVVVWHTGATRLIPGGYLAVDLFFVLSGFVLAYAFGERRGWAAFMGARLKRLYPLYIAGALLGAVIFLRWVPFDARYAETVGAAAFMLPTPVAWGTYRPYPLDTPAWSLLFELLVNGVWFALLPWLSARALGAIIALSGALLALVIAANGGVQVGDAGAWFLPLGFTRATFSFFAGVACFRVWKTHPANWAPPAWLLGTTLLVPIMLPLPRAIVDPLAVFVVFPLLIYLGAGTALVGRAAGACDLAGRASYAVYTLHAPLLSLGSVALVALLPTFGHRAYLIAVIGVPLMLVVGVLADRFYDTPLRSARFPTSRRTVVMDSAVDRASTGDG